MMPMMPHMIFDLLAARGSAEAPQRRSLHLPDLRFVPDPAPAFLAGFALVVVFLRLARKVWARPVIFTWRPRAIAIASAGTFSVMTLPAPTMAPAPIVTGATSELFEPMETLGPITVRDLLKPS